MHSPGKEDPDPETSNYVEHVRCPHGQLSQSSALRTWINEDVSLFLFVAFHGNKKLNDIQCEGMCLPPDLVS